MSFLLDSDICSAYLKGDRRVHGRYIQYSGQLHASAITVAELITWSSRSHAPATRKQYVLDFLDDLTLLDVDGPVAHTFGQLRASQLDTGKLTPKVDLFIAATALTYNLTLVTHNTQDFTNVPGLRVQDWLVP